MTSAALLGLCLLALTVGAGIFLRLGRVIALLEQQIALMDWTEDGDDDGGGTPVPAPVPLRRIG